MSSLITLLALADSRLPTGGHVHSGGMEEAVTSLRIVLAAQQSIDEGRVVEL